MLCGGRAAYPFVSLAHDDSSGHRNIGQALSGHQRALGKRNKQRVVVTLSERAAARHSQPRRRTVPLMLQHSQPCGLTNGKLQIRVPYHSEHAQWEAAAAAVVKKGCSGEGHLVRTNQGTKPLLVVLGRHLVRGAIPPESS